MGAIAQLCVIVAAPGPEAAVIPDGYGVVASHGDLPPILRGTDLDRRFLLQRGSVAQLSVLIRSPGPERAVTADAGAVIAAG